jgi:putative peptidoglycan lipid II flippase
LSGGGFFRSTSIVGGLTLLSRVTGLLRDMVYSRMFGAGVLMDAFLVAFKIPNFMRRLFAEGAFSQAFVPVVSEYKVQRTHAEVRDLVDGAMGTMAWFMSVITVVGIVAAPVFVLLFAPGSTRTGQSSTSRSTCCAGRFRTCSSSRWRRSLPASSTVTSASRCQALMSTLMNLVMIGFAAWIAPRFEQPGVALSVGCSSRVPCSSASSCQPWCGWAVAPPRWRWGDAGVKKDRSADAARDLRLIGVPGRAVARHVDRIVPRDRQHLLAVLRRSPDGVPAWRLQRGARR